MANTPRFHGTPIIEDKHGKTLRPITRGQQELLEAMESNDIVFVNGPAGTGKSTLATWYGIAGIDSGLYDKLVLTRPIVEAGEELGFLPGTFEEKVAPYMQPLYEAIEKVKGKRVINTENTQLSNTQLKSYNKNSKVNKKPTKQIEEIKYSNEDFYKKVDVCPLAYLRGSTKAKSFIILDECFTGNTLIGYHVHGDKSCRSIKQLYKDFNNGIDLYTKSFNVDSNEYEDKKILNVSKKKSSNLVNIKLNGRKRCIKCTMSHPFATMGADGIEWKMASDLNKSDKLIKYTNGHNNAVDLNEYDYDIILGLLLGDGSLNRNKSKTPAYRIQWIHGINQSEYNEFLINILSGTNRTGLKSGYTNKPLVGGTTRSLKLSQGFVDSLYKNGKKTITNDIIKYFTDRSLAIWIMDDGYYNKKSNILYLNTQGFTYEENIILSNMLDTLYDIKPSIDKTDNYYMLRFKVEDTKKIFELVSSAIHPSMEYKLAYDYRNKFNINTYITKTCYNYTTTNIEYVESINSNEYVYNLEIEDNNNYLVDGILVHNCQNVTPTQLKLMLTRLGYGSKLILCGDATQSDLDHNSKSGFTDAQKLLKGIDGIGFVTLGIDDIVRHKLIRDIIIRYETKDRNKHRDEAYSNRFDRETDQENYRDMRNYDLDDDDDDDDDDDIEGEDDGYEDEYDDTPDVIKPIKK